MIDPDSRRWGAGHWGDHMRAELVGDALLAAFGNRRRPEGVISIPTAAARP